MISISGPPPGLPGHGRLRAGGRSHARGAALGGRRSKDGKKAPGTVYLWSGGKEMRAEEAVRMWGTICRCSAVICSSAIFRFSYFCGIYFVRL